VTEQPAAVRRTWAATAPPDVGPALRPAGLPWWIGGGHVLDELAGRQRRPHDDLDIVVPRDLLVEWTTFLADAGWAVYRRARPEPVGPVDARDVARDLDTPLWVGPAGSPTWAFELVPMPIAAGWWRAAPDPRLHLRLPPPGGWLPAELVLFLKGDRLDRPKHRADVEWGLGALAVADRDWLVAAFAAAGTSCPAGPA